MDSSDRKQAQGGQRPSTEPVPDSCPVCPRILPANMPSDYVKARAHVAKRTKKDPDTLTIREIIKFYSEDKPKIEVL